MVNEGGIDDVLQVGLPYPEITSVHEVQRLQDLFEAWQIRFGNLQSNLHQINTFQTEDKNHHNSLYVAQYNFTHHEHEFGWMLAVFDTQDIFLGARLTSFFDKRPKLNAVGQIEVLRRGHGIASAIESLHGKLLQNLVSTYQGIDEVKYTITDANQDIVHFADDPTMRQRWKALYGVGGTFGFDL